MKCIKIFFISALFIALFMNSALAQTNTSTTYKNIYPFADNVSHKGIYSSTDFFFEKSKFTKFNTNTYIHLNLSYSEKLLYDFSFITIFLNDIPIKSISFSDFKQDPYIFLPINNINTGFNKITIKTYTRTTELPCVDKASPSNWIVFNKDSFLHLDYSYLEDTNSIREFPYPYILTDKSIFSNSFIVLPSAPTSNEIHGALKMNSILATHTKSELANLQILKYSDLNEAAKNNNLIFICDKPSSFADLNIKYKSDDLGYIKEMNSPYNPQKKVFLVCGNINKALNYLFNKESISKTTSDEKIVNENKTQTPQKNNLNKITFSSLGYENLKLKGVNNTHSNIYMKIPNYSIENSKLNLNFNYSKGLDFDNSSINIYVNNEFLASKKLSSKNANMDYLSITIPKKLLQKRFLNIKIQFNLYLNDFNCNLDEEDAAFANILNTSYFDFNVSKNTQFLFNYYPYPFVKDDKFNNLTFVFDDFNNFDNINILSNMITFLSTNLKYYPEFKIYNKLDKSLSKDNIIVLSSYDSDNLLKNINKNLNLKYNANTKRYIENDKIRIYNNQDAHSSIQLIKSPFNKNNAMLIVNSLNKDNLRFSRFVLGYPDKVYTLQGDTILLSEDAVDTYAYYNKQAVYEIKHSKYNTYNDFSIKIKSNAKLVAASFIFIIFVLLTTIILFKKK